MIRYCKHCGTLVENDATTCTFCGATVEAAAPDPVPQPEAPQTPAQKKFISIGKKWTKKQWLITGGIVLAVIAVIAAISLLFLNPQSALDRHSSVCNGNFQDIESLAPKAYWSTIVRKTAVTSSVDKYIQDQAKELELTYLQYQAFGISNFGLLNNISYQACDIEKVTTRDLDDIKDYLEEHYNISPTQVGDAYNMIVKIVYHGSDSDYTTVAYLTSIQIDGQWYLIQYQRINNTFTVSFIVGDLLI